MCLRTARIRYKSIELHTIKGIHRLTMIMQMLIGVLTQVVEEVTNHQKEKEDMVRIQERLLQHIQEIDIDGNHILLESKILVNILACPLA